MMPGTPNSRYKLDDGIRRFLDEPRRAARP